MNCQDIIQRGTQAAYEVKFADGLEATLVAVTLEWGNLGERLRIPAETMDDNVFTFDTSDMWGTVDAVTEYVVGGLRRIDCQPLAYVKDVVTPPYIVRGVDTCASDVALERVTDTI